MSTLQIRVEYPGGSLPLSPMATDILNDQFDTLFSGMIYNEMDVPVEPGSYLVLARLPSGETIRRSVKVGEEQILSVELAVPPSAHEFLQWQRFFGNSALRMERTLADFPPLTWLQLWAYDQQSWSIQTQSLLQRYIEHDEYNAVYQVKWERWQLQFCQVGGDTIPWRFVSIPISGGGYNDSAEIVIHPARRADQYNGGLAIEITSRDLRSEMLLYYLADGAFEQAEMLSPDAIIWENGDYEDRESLTVARDLTEEGRISEAEILLRDKLKSPISAAIGGYYLLRIGAYERLHDWPNNFANWIRWLPDAPIIHAWQLIRQQSNESDLELARERLLQAEERGVPLYTEGLRLLVDGLQLFADEDEAQNRSDMRVRNALQRIRRYAAAADWDQRLTTFYGVSPEQPSLKLRTGVHEQHESLAKIPMGYTNAEHYRLIRQGVEFWNSWRSKSPDIRPELREAYLQGGELQNFNLQNCDLATADLSSSQLQGANLAGANLRNAELSSAHLDGAVLQNSTLEDALCYSTYFNDANLQGANLCNATLDGAEMAGAQLRNANLEGVDLQYARNLTVEQLSQVSTLINAKLDEELARPLMENYPHLFGLQLGAA